MECFIISGLHYNFYQACVRGIHGVFYDDHYRVVLSDLRRRASWRDHAHGAVLSQCSTQLAAPVVIGHIFYVFLYIF
jgi:hypothetical protein